MLLLWYYYISIYIFSIYMWLLYIHHYVYIYIIIYMKNTFVYNICIQPVYLYATLSNPLHIYKSKYALNRISTDIWYIYIYIHVSSFYANPLYLSSMSWPYTFYPLGQGTAPKIAPQPKSSQSRGSFPKKEPPDAASGSTAAGLAASFARKKTGQGGWTLPETNSLVSQNSIFSGKFPNGCGECGDGV